MGIYNTRDLDVMCNWAESLQDSPIPVCAAARLAARQQHQIDERVDMALLPIRAVSSGSARGTEKHRPLTFGTVRHQYTPVVVPSRLQVLGQAMELVQLAVLGAGPGLATLFVKYGG